MKIIIDNLKCGGCASTITKKIAEIEGVSDVSVSVENAEVSFTTSEDEIIEKVKQKLADLGYPESGTNNTIKHKAKSLVSCAVGKISN
ncbi:MAG: heavy metal transporter [Flavobacteriales bacterium]|nr:MAG: heavy metal transporter [Flavobacteriales bacterium]